MKRFLTPAFALLFAFPSALSAQTRTITLRKGTAVVQVTPTVGPGLARPPASAAPRSALATWQPMNVPGGVYVRAISMGTSQVGFAAGELGIVLKTVDGGSNWTTILNQGFPYYWYGCHAFDANTVVVSGFQNQSGDGVLRWSDDGGAHWSADVVLPAGAGVRWLDRVRFLDLNRGIVENSWSGGVDHTTTGGRTPADWTFTQPSPNWYIGTFTFLDDARVWMSGYDFEFSPDATSTWSNYSGTTAIFDGPNSIHQNGIGFTGGGSISPTVAGWVYKTANAGHDFTASPVLSTAYPIRALLTFDTQRAWAAGGNVFSGVGGIWGTIDGGSSWNLEQNVGNEINDLQWVRVDANTVNVFAAGYVSQIWRATISAPVGGGLVATSYGFCDAPVAPCSNPYESGGCTSQAGTGTFLYGSGTSSVAADDLALHATQLPTQKLGLYFMGPAQQLAIAGNGLRVIAGGASGLKRFSAGNSGAAGVIDLGPGIVAYSQAHFPASSHIQAGQTWNFQCYYRDPTGPCGATFNTTNGFSVAFAP
ncbi:MAG TPA: hypothetical protein VGR31_06250 [Planctomycetota bacterium]|jgi:photosystem II stability/assembly factor-like uncharacterized protein|nr:hypothetical protein [Planctomycetota bacterium]